MRYQDLKSNLTKRYNAAVRLYETIATDHEAVLDQLRGGCPNARHQLQEYVDALQTETVHLHKAHTARASAIPELDEGQRLQEETQFPETREKVYELLSKIADATVTLLSNLKATQEEENKTPQREGSGEDEAEILPTSSTRDDSDQMDVQPAVDPATRTPSTDDQHNYTNVVMQNVHSVPEEAAPQTYAAGMEQNNAFHQAHDGLRNPFMVHSAEDFVRDPTQTVPTRGIAEKTTFVSPQGTSSCLPTAQQWRRTEDVTKSQDALWITTPRTPGRVEWADDYGAFRTPMTHIAGRTPGMATFAPEENVPRRTTNPATVIQGTYPARGSAGTRAAPLPYVQPAANHVSTGTLVYIAPDPVSRHDGIQEIAHGMQRLTTAELPNAVNGSYVRQQAAHGVPNVREHTSPYLVLQGSREQTYAVPRRTHVEPPAQQMFPDEERGFRPRIDPPKIRLPTFHGRRGEDWNKFASMFKAVIHNRSDISDEEKLWYLIGCLQDDAANVISGLKYTAECYPIAMELLEERYGDRDEAKRKLVEELRRLGRAARTDGYEYYDKLMSIVNQLRALGTNTEEEPLRVLIDDTVPQWIRTYVDQERLREPAWTTAKLLTTIRRVVHLFSNRRDHDDFRITTIPAANSPSNNQSKQHLQQRLQQQRTFDNSRNMHEEPEEMRPQSRTNIRCSTPPEQLQDRPETRRCYNCGRHGHLAAHCRSRDKNSNSNVVYEQIEEVPTVQLTSNDHKADGETPLPIAQGYVINPSTGRRVKTLILLDTGSQKDYVTDALVDALQLQRMDEKTITINGFLGKKTSVQAATTQVLIEGRKGDRTKVTATCIKRPVNPLHLKRVAEDGKSLVSHFGIPSVILGNTSAWKFIKGKSKKVVDGFKCLDSTLGLLLTGERAEVEEATAAIANVQYCSHYIGDRNSMKTIGCEKVKKQPRTRRKRRSPPVRRSSSHNEQQLRHANSSNDRDRLTSKDADERHKAPQDCASADIGRKCHGARTREPAGAKTGETSHNCGRPRDFHSERKNVQPDYPESAIPKRSRRRRKEAVQRREVL